MVLVFSKDATMECVQKEGDDAIAGSKLALSDIALSVLCQNMYHRMNMKIFRLLIWKQGQCKTVGEWIVRK